MNHWLETILGIENEKIYNQYLQYSIKVCFEIATNFTNMLLFLQKIRFFFAKTILKYSDNNTKVSIELKKRKYFSFVSI